MADAAVTAGRGVVFIALAKLYFMMAGYVITFLLPRLLGSDAQWGDYGVVVRFVSVIDNVIVTATIQAVSKFTAQDESAAAGVKSAALRLQLILGGCIGAAYLAAAPWIAHWERDASLTNLYRLSTGIMLFYSFYSVFVGSLNGLKRFGRQATLDMTFSTLKMALILGFAVLGWGAAGAIGGFVLAAAAILVTAAAWVGLPRRAQPFSIGTIVRFMLPLYAYHLALNLLMGVDLFLLKRLVGAFAADAGAGARAKVASVYAAYYYSLQYLAFIPYQAILAVAFVIFPLVSRSTFEKDLPTTQAYIRQTMRLSLIFVAGVAVVFAANPDAVIHVVYPSHYRVGGPALRILSVGMVCFSMFTIINTILNGAGRTGLAILCSVVTLAAAASANQIFIPMAATAEDALVHAAWATSGAMLLGALLSTVLVYRCFSAGFSLASALRIVVAMAAAFAVGHIVPERSKLVTLAECVLVLVVYAGVLVALREFKSEDVARFRRVFARQRTK